MVNGKGVLRGSISTDPKRISANLPGTLEFHAYEAPDGGYDLGYSEGYAEGYRVGVSEGKEQGRSEGYAQGHSAGYEAGYTAGYEAGYAKGLADGEASGYEKGVAEVEAQNAQTLAKCNTALSEKGVETAESLEEVPGRIGEIKAETYDFSKVKRLAIRDMNPFGKSDVVLNLNECDSLQNAFQLHIQNTTVEHLTINCPVALASIGGCFMFNGAAQDYTLKRLTLNLNMGASQFNGTWLYYARALEVIDGTPLDFSSETSANIEQVGCTALKEIRFKPSCMKTNFWFGNSPNLSDESIQSILDGLADLTGGTAKILTLHATVGAKLTDEQKAAVAAKNWTLAY